MSAVESGTGASLASLERSLRFRLARQAVLSGNVANVDTPGYRRSELSFEDALDRAAAPVRTDPRHLSAGSGPDRSWSSSRGERGDGPDRNGVDFDGEMIKLTRNAGAFTEAANVHARITALMRMAISGDGA